MKERVLDVLWKRKEYFDNKIGHSHSSKRIAEAIEIIENFIPPDGFDHLSNRLEKLVSLPKRELLEKLEFAQRELDMLYHFAISNGIAEAGNPPHKIIADYIKQIKQA